MKPRHVVRFIVACHCLPWLPAMAQNTLTVPAELVRISNPELTATSGGDVTLVRVSPQYTIQKVDGPTRIEWGFGATVERSSNTDLSANRTLPRASVLWETTTPLSVIALRGSLEEASTRETEFAEFGRVTRDSTERVGTLGATWTRNITEGSRWELSATQREVSYDTDALTDFSETAASAAYLVDASPTARWSFTGSVASVNPQGSGDNSTRSGLGFGYETALSETFALVAGAGIVRTSGPLSQTKPVGNLRLTYEGERIGYLLGWSRDVSAGGSIGGFTRSQNVTASIRFALGADKAISFGVDHAKAIDGLRDAGATAYARYTSTLTPFWTFTAGLEQRRAMPATGPSASGNALSVGLVYSHPDF
jgi:hypothetical protein